MRQYKFKKGDVVKVVYNLRHIPEDHLILRICRISKNKCYCALPLNVMFNPKKDYINWYDEYELQFANGFQQLCKEIS